MGQVLVVAPYVPYPGTHGGSIRSRVLSSFVVSVGDVVQLRSRSKMQARVDDNMNAGRGQVPQWLTLDPNEKKGTVRSMPLREDIQIPVSEQLIVELYSK